MFVHKKAPDFRGFSFHKDGIDALINTVPAGSREIFRINGVAGQTAELLEAAGVDTVKELSTRNAANLHAKLIEVNKEFGLTGKVPSLEMVEGMILASKSMEPKVFH